MSTLAKLVLGLIAIILLLAVAVYIRAGWGERVLDEDARSLAPGAFLETPAGKLHYRWHGDAGNPVIVMAHGFSTPNFIFEQNADALVAAGYRVLTFDHFGRGWSDRPKAKYNPDFYDQELADLLDGLGLSEPVGLVGLSMGGVITAEFTARHPERVSRLFLFVPAGLSLGGDAGDTNDRLLRTPILGDWVWRVFGKSILLGDPQYDESKLGAANRLAGDVTQQMSYRGYFRALLSSYRHLPMRDQDEVFARLGDTGVPIMAVFGDQDTTVPPESARRLEALIPSARVEILPEGEHGLNYQMHEITNPMLVNYFGENP
jgi:pimeloyl-ACP methyl ester carboxylesterase